MKRTLYVVRHSVAEENSSSGADFDRLLTEKGIMRAKEMAARLKERGAFVRAVVSSQAPRAAQTAEIMAAVLGGIDLRLERTLYFGGVEAYFQAVNETHDAMNDLMIVGHNPDISTFVNRLTAENLSGLKKCSVAIIELSSTWREVKPNEGILKSIENP